ncbi:MAG: 50S ribosomal protein L6 [Myxococcota bacterium]
MGEAAEKQSRNGKKPVALPQGVEVKIDGHKLEVKGPKGTIAREFRSEVVVEKDGESLVVKPADGTGKMGRQFQGLTRAIVRNMVEGAKDGYKRSLDFRGVGYRAEMKGRILKMTVGLSHQPELEIPTLIDVKIEQMDEGGMKYPRVHLESIDKELVGRIAARIRSFRPPEPYQGKGIRYTGEKIREKAGKSGK